MALYSPTYNLTDGTIAYGSQVRYELSALGSSVNNVINEQIPIGANISDDKLATISTGQKVNLTALVATSQAQGDIIYASSATAMERLAAGTSGQFLKTLGAGANPVWAWGGMVQQVEGSTSAVVTVNSDIPKDDSIPQNTEGVEVTTVSITPKSASNILIVEFGFWVGIDQSGQAVAALFQDSTANALNAWLGFQAASGAGGIWYGSHRMTSGTTSATTFKLRVGCNATIYINGTTGNRYFGGVSKAFLRVTEIAV